MDKTNVRNIFKVIAGFVAFWALCALLVRAESASDEANIHTLFDAFWYSIVTITTVGYGDFYPVTVGGKAIGFLLILSSIGLLGYLVGKMSSHYYHYLQKRKMGHLGTNFNSHFVIIGWSTFSKEVLENLLATDNKVAVISNKKEDVEAISDKYDSNRVFGLFTSYENYENYALANIDSSSKVLVNFEDDTKNLIEIINLRKYYPTINVVVSLNSHDLRDTFKSIGVTFIVSKNSIASKLVASYIFEPDVASYTEELMEPSVHGHEYGITQFLITASNPYLNQQYNDTFVRIKADYNAILLGICKTKNGNQLLKNPKESCTIEEGDYLLLIINNEAQKVLESDFEVKEGRIS